MLLHTPKKSLIQLTYFSRHTPDMVLVGGESSLHTHHGAPLVAEAEVTPNYLQFSLITISHNSKPELPDNSSPSGRPPRLIEMTLNHSFIL